MWVVGVIYSSVMTVMKSNLVAGVLINSAIEFESDLVHNEALLTKDNMNKRRLIPALKCAVWDIIKLLF